MSSLNANEKELKKKRDRLKIQESGKKIGVRFQRRQEERKPPRWGISTFFIT